MRVGLGCTMLEPLISSGQIDGIGVYTKYLIEELKQAHQSIIPLSFPPLHSFNKKIISEIPQGQFFRLPYLVHTGISLLTPYQAYGNLEKQLDIFHATDHLVPHFKKIPVVATLHDGLILSHPEWYNARLRKLKNFIRIKTMQWANHIITISNSMLEEIIQYWHIPRDKITVIYNGIDDDWLLPISAEKKYAVAQQLKLPEKFLLSVGTLQPKKNIPRVIQAFLQLPLDLQQEYPLIIVGKAGWNTTESLAAINHLEVSGRGRWLKYVSDDALKALFQLATLYLHPSLHEGFGLTLLQGFASSVPVLTSNISAMPEVAADAAYLVDPYSTHDITHGIKTLLLNETLRQSFISKGNARVKLFSWQRCAREVLHTYQKVLG